MDESLKTFLIDLAGNIGLFALVTLVYLRLRPAGGGWPPAGRQAVIGLLFGAFAVIGMIEPVRLASGLLIDGRNVMVALAGPFGGPVAGLAAAALTAGYRLWLGGPGAPAGIYSLMWCAALGIGIGWHARRSAGGFGRSHLVVLAVCVVATSSTAFLLLPEPAARLFLDTVVVPMGIANLFGIVFLGLLLIKEEQRQALAEALAESQRRFGAIVANAPGGVYQRVLTADGRLSFPYCSPGFHDLVGIPRDEVITLERLEARLHPDDRPALVASVRASAEALHSPAVEVRYRAEDDRYRWVRLTSRLRRRRNGDVVWDGFALDVTGRKRREAELRAAVERAEQAGRLNARFAKAIEATGTGVFILDAVRAEYPVVFVNAAFSTITGYPAEAVLGHGDHVLYGPETDPATVARVLEARSTGSRIAVEMQCRRRNGDPFWAAIDLSPVAGAGGTVEAFVGILEDATPRKHHEEQLRRARLDAEAANRAKDDFLAAMSHEIRTPMTGVIGFADLLLDTALDADQRRYASHVRESGRSLLSVVDDILNFSGIEAGRLELRDASISLRDLAASCEAAVRLEARANGLGVSVAVGPDVPDVVRGDPDRLRQVMLNLLGNAVRFTDAGSIMLTVARTAETDGGPRITVQVADTGIGIPEEKQGMLFQRFSQVDRTRGGTGLGLAVSRRIVERMGGTIGMRSEPGIGSTFWFSVVLPEVRGPCMPAPQGAPVATLRHAPRPARLLVVEDLPMNRDLVVGMLSAAGHRVDAVADGRAAVAAVADGAYDLVLMDVQMSDMDGLEATRAIRALPSPAGRVPVLALSAGALPGEVARCREAGMDGHLAKPVDRSRLLAAIDGAIPG